jgi:MinD-like ATPase involved in chromosome partitioning or flagellar assembly
LIPDDVKSVNGANNTGEPVVFKSPTSKVAQAITELALDLFDRRKRNGAEPTGAANPLTMFRSMFRSRVAL